METLDNRSTSLTFVTCIESGALEWQVVRLAETLRRWGGVLAGAPFMAIKPRFGPEIEKPTRSKLEALNVDYRSIKPGHDIDWYHTINKPTALAYAEQVAQTDFIAWLDGDTLVIGQPNELILGPDEDFAAMPASCEDDIGSRGPEDDHDPYWQVLCDALGIKVNALPMIPAQPRESGQMRMYWQGGVYVYRREKKLAACHLETYLRRIKTRIASRHAGVYFYDQTSLAIAVLKLGLRWRQLSVWHNYAINKILADKIDTDGVREARIVHYFGSAWPDFFERFRGCFKDTRPDVYKWLGTTGPLGDFRPGWKRAWAKILKTLRSRRYAAFAESCSIH